jgi:hypothetical protein
MSKTAFVLGAEKALEIINRMPEYDAVFVDPTGKVFYSNGLRPAGSRPEGAAPAPGDSKKKSGCCGPARSRCVRRDVAELTPRLHVHEGRPGASPSVAAVTDV